MFLVLIKMAKLQFCKRKPAFDSSRTCRGKKRTKAFGAPPPPPALSSFVQLLNPEERKDGELEFNHLLFILLFLLQTGQAAAGLKLGRSPSTRRGITGNYETIPRRELRNPVSAAGSPKREG